MRRVAYTKSKQGTHTNPGQIYDNHNSLLDFRKLTFHPHPHPQIRTHPTAIHFIPIPYPLSPIHPQRLFTPAYRSSSPIIV